MTIKEGSISGRGASASSPADTMENMGSELGRRADEAGDRLSNSVREKVHEIDVTRQHLQERAEYSKDRMVSGVHEGRTRVTQKLQANPTRTLLLTAGIGILAGLLLARRMRK